MLMCVFFFLEHIRLPPTFEINRIRRGMLSSLDSEWKEKLAGCFAHFRVYFILYTEYFSAYSACDAVAYACISVSFCLVLSFFWTLVGGEGVVVICGDGVGAGDSGGCCVVVKKLSSHLSVVCC